MLRKIYKKIGHYIKSMLRRIISFLPFKIDTKKIVFDNFLGKGYGCNPKYIAEELIRQNVDCEMVWLVSDLNSEMPQEIRKVKYGSLKAHYELATAKIWIDNVRNYKGVEKKKDQFYIQTWHAPLGLKKIEGQVEDMLNDRYVKEAKKDGKIMDLIMVNNDYMADIIKKYFWYEGEILKIGVPREDIIGDTPKEIFEKVYSYFGIEKSRKIIIYAPTFRTDGSINAYKFDYEAMVRKYSEFFNEEFVMLIRLHPNVSKFADSIEYSKNVFNVSDYPDIQELLAVSEIAITDYSSIMFDFSMYNKPVFLLIKDIDMYKKQERSLEFNIEELPFPIARTEEELWNAIKNFSKKEYNDKCNIFYKNIGLINNNNASAEIVKIIKEKINVA